MRRKNVRVMTVVGRVVGKGQKQYVVTRANNEIKKIVGKTGGLITFSIFAWNSQWGTLWSGRPIFLLKLKKTPKGWRALKVCPAPMRLKKLQQRQ